VPSGAFLLFHLALGAELLENHLCVAAFVGVGVVETHFEVRWGVVEVRTGVL
jgi:hypothetical protein